MVKYFFANSDLSLTFQGDVLHESVTILLFLEEQYFKPMNRAKYREKFCETLPSVHPQSVALDVSPTTTTNQTETISKQTKNNTSATEFKQLQTVLRLSRTNPQIKRISADWASRE